ncbi:MAG: hypothetical protein U5K73_00635 [Halofilum sp. (in: g-proteobacteria)]|nr:hypothetical protein [Halofilum sp. (in: g-proteobacteria)]
MTSEPGVRCVQPDCGEPLVHRYEGGDYGLEDIPELFQVGRVASDPDGPERIELRAEEIRELKVLADAYSFDFEGGLIQLCLDLHRFALDRREDTFTFVQDF